MILRQFADRTVEGAMPTLQDVVGALNIDEVKYRALVSNPCFTRETPIQLLGVESGKIIGRVIVFPKRFWADGCVLEGIGSEGLYVDPAFRKISLVGPELSSAISELPRDHMNSVCNISHDARRLTKIWKGILFYADRLIFAKHCRPVVRKYFPVPFLRTILSCAIDCGLAAYWLLIRILLVGLYRKVSVVEETHADPIIGSMVEEDTHRFREVHDTPWFNWILQNKFPSDKVARQRLFTIRNKEGCVIGFFMYKIRHYAVASHRGFKDVTMASLIEWQVLQGERFALGNVLRLAALQMLKEPVDMVEICTDDHAAYQALRHIGGWPMSNLAYSFGGKRGNPLTLHDGWKEQCNWRLRPGDGDNALA